MKASELRIGNFFDVINRKSRIHRPYGVVRKVGCISFFKVELYEVDKPFAQQIKSDMTDISNLSPIPLTEEWLLKFGIEKKENEEYPTYHSWYKGLFNIENADDDAVKNGVHFVFEVYSHYIPVKYVHQLQNLYFALTGEELEIKS